VKLGISSYSLFGAMKDGRMNMEQAMEWIAEQGAVHVEIVPGLGFDIEEPGLADRIREKSSTLGLDISNYAVGGNFVGGNDFEAEVAKAIRHVNIAHQLGAQRMRHDVAWRSPAEAVIEQFEVDMERMVTACRTIADYALPYGIITSVENHGFHVQSSDRVLRLYHAVDRPNFKITMDIGNFMCADENSVAAVKKTIPYASMVHLKDFYLRPSSLNPGKGWFSTIAGNYLRGAILGHGDLDLREVLRIVKGSGYDGYVSIEFEGMEDCLAGTSIGLENARKLWDEI
jgi:sugar phosphate isomerase/epimerase